MLYPAREARKKTETKAQLSRRLQLDRFYYKRAHRDLFGSSIESIHSIKKAIQHDLYSIERSILFSFARIFPILIFSILNFFISRKRNVTNIFIYITR